MQKGLGIRQSVRLDRNREDYTKDSKKLGGGGGAGYEAEDRGQRVALEQRKRIFMIQREGMGEVRHSRAPNALKPIVGHHSDFNNEGTVAGEISEEAIGHCHI